MLPFLYRAKRSDIGGVVDVFSLRRVQIHCRFLEIFDQRTSTSVEPSFLDGECIHNQRCYGTMETTERCSVSNWSRIHHPRSSDCSGKWLFRRDKIVGIRQIDID